MLLRGCGTPSRSADGPYARCRSTGQPGAMVSDPAGKLFAVVVLDIAADGHISAVRAIVNPDKLRHLDQERSADS